MPLHLRRLESLRAVAMHGSVSRAAKHLHKVPSAVSYDLHALQRELRAELFFKHGRGIRLTEQGRLLAEASERSNREIERAIDRVQRPQVHKEPLRVSSVSGFGRYRLTPALLRLVSRDRPLELTLAHAETVLRNVEAGVAAFGVSYKPLVSSSIVVAPIAEESIVLIGAPRSRAPKRQQIASLPFVTYDEFEYVYAEWFRAQALAPPERWNRSDHMLELEEAIEAVAANRGFCVVPADAAMHVNFRNRVVIHEWPRKRCRNAIYLLSQPPLKNSDDAQLIARAATGAAQ
jgi:DNA-binding transcriptional LysR family regulator